MPGQDLAACASLSSVWKLVLSRSALARRKRICPAPATLASCSSQALARTRGGPSVGAGGAGGADRAAVSVRAAFAASVPLVGVSAGCGGSTTGGGAADVGGGTAGDGGAGAGGS